MLRVFYPNTLGEHYLLWGGVPRQISPSCRAERLTFPALQWWMLYIIYGWFFGLLQELKLSKSSKGAGRRRIPNFPVPDYSGIQPKVDCWRSNSKIGCEDNEVSGAVLCSVVQM
jgi:hypothetical protein